MELIIKPTGRCNFNCTFCSAGLLNIKHQTKVPEELKKVINTIKPDGLIFTGGDPLCVNPSYYEEILTLGEFNIAFTTNLKDFYFHPEKWENLFKNKRLGIGTSFQYGNDRLWDKNTPYTEEMFIKVMTMFKERIGYVPPFISLINNANEKQALDHLHLAKKLNTKCKLNMTLALGKSKNFYPLYKMIDIWLKAKELGLDKYQDTKIQFYNGGCNFNTNLSCKSTIRAFWLSNTNEITYSWCEDCGTSGLTLPLDTKKVIPTKEKLDINTLLSEKCLTCELCNLCNACTSLRNTNKQTKNHCEEMLKRKEIIMRTGWKL